MLLRKKYKHFNVKMIWTGGDAIVVTDNNNHLIKVLLTKRKTYYDIADLMNEEEQNMFNDAMGCCNGNC